MSKNLLAAHLGAGAPTLLQVPGQQQQMTAKTTFAFDPIMFEKFKKHIQLINAEWGIQLNIFSSLNQFKDCLQNNVRKTGKAVILFRDVKSIIKRQFQLKSEDGNMIRFLDANELKIIVDSDHVIY